ncbi:MAG: hypothetical protein ABJK64_01220 [Paraglaciecola sp.]|uniref:hypothetical protein n=1 Tax=Paraglaciecola sp. TaxID=1920173 RepID=UPI0032992C8F
MLQTVKKRRLNITLAVIFALLFNAIASLYVSASMLNNAKSFAAEDSVLICTGSSYKWMSLSVYELTGKVEYIEPPENTPHNSQDIRCVYGYLSDAKYNDLVINSFDHLVIPIDVNLNINYFEALYPNAKHQLSLTRGPPFSLPF